MAEFRLALARLVGLALALLFFGGALILGIYRSGHRYTGAIAGPTIAILLGLLLIAALWQASRFTYARHVTIAMLVVFLASWPLRLLINNQSPVVVTINATLVLAAFILALGRGKSDDEVPLANMRRRSEARGLPRLNARRAKKGLSPVASFKEARAEQRRQR
jgi:hypothetical protein